MIKPIRNETDYEAALKRVDELMNAAPNTPEMDELEVLVTLVQSYEDKHYFLDAPDPISAIKFRMEQEGLQQKDLISIIGDKAVVSKVLSGQRKLTAQMIKNLHEQLNIPFESLFSKAVCA
ncbi:MAG: DNA-binding protein [Sulfurospirillaceae bacterium]|nr:DNA-binding protein [Sulfurospirillaceae bacterium]MCK9546175.1 DNA-binding protein [Sulfurospirillaceae bacterium]